MSDAHDVVNASDMFYECRCGHVSVSRFGHDAHSGRHDDANDPTERTNFNPGEWTGTLTSGLISVRSECARCGKGWHEGDCAAGGEQPHA